MKLNITKQVMIAVAASCILFMCGCKGDATATSPLVGTWTRLFNGSPVFIALKANGSYSVHMTEGGKADVKGKYTAEGDQVIFIDEAGKNASTSGQSAVYGFVVQDNQLTLTAIDEPDENRKSVAAATWTRKT